MNTPTPFPRFCRCPGPRGVALVVTLMMMSVLVMMVVGLAGVMRNEQAAARNLTYQVIADQMADLGARVAMAAVLSNSTGSIGRPAASGPGWMCINGTAVGLFSSNASGQLKNVEEIGTNSLVLGLPDSSRGQLWVSWSNLVGPDGTLVGRYAWWVDDEGTKVNLNAVGSNNTNVYLPLLTAFPISADYLFIDPATGQTNNASSARARALAGRSNSLPTTESLKDTNAIGLTGSNTIGPTDYRRAKGYLTAWSSNTDLTPWGSSKVNLADPNLTAPQIKAALSTNAWTNFFGANMSLARKYGGGSLTAGAAGNAGDLALDQIVQNIRVAAGNTPTVVLFSGNSGNTDLLRHRNQLPSNPVGLTLSPFLSEAALSVSSLDTSAGSPSISVAFNFQIEVVNPWSVPLNNYQLEIQPRKLRFHIGYNRTPADVAPAVNPPYGTPWPDANGSSQGLTGSQGCWVGPMMEDSNPWPINTLITAPVASVPARSYAQIPVIQTFVCTFPSGLNPAPNNMRVDQAYVMIDKIVLKDAAGNPVDWVTLDDFSQPANFGTTNTAFAPDLGQLIFAPTYPVGRQGTGFITTTIDFNGSPFLANLAQGLAKNDPQVRFPAAVWDANNRGSYRANGFPATLQAWKRVAGGSVTGPGSSPPPPSVSMGAANLGIFDVTNTSGAVTGISYLRPDPVTNGTTLLTHPHFVSGYRPTNGFKSVAQLGAIHTGLPWRTLRLQPTPAAERTGGGANNFPPDWVLLDVFTATSPAAFLPSLNANGIPMAMAGGSLGVASNVNGTIPSRSWSLVSAMASAGSPISRTNTNAFASNGVPLSLTNAAAAYGNLGAVASNLTAVLTNPSGAGGWSTNSDWRNSRSGRAIYPANGLLLRGEILEIQGVAEDTNSPSTLGEDVVEGRLRSFLDLVSTRSDTFSVWSVGQGLNVTTNRGNRTNIMGEVRKQVVFQRIPQTNAAGNVIGYQLKAVYTRNHVVE